jgi:hypothetical protein
MVDPYLDKIPSWPGYIKSSLRFQERRGRSKAATARKIVKFLERQSKYCDTTLKESEANTTG